MVKLPRIKHKDSSDAKYLYAQKFEIQNPDSGNDDGLGGVHSLSPTESGTPPGSKQVFSPLNDVLSGNPPLPKWYNPFQIKRYKQKLIIDRLKEFCAPIKISETETHTPTEKDVLEYKKELDGLKIKQLTLMGRMINVPLKLDFLDRMKSYNRKEHALVTIFNDNKTSDTGVIHCYDRTFSRNNMSYLVMSERGIMNPEHKMLHFYYYANHSCPILFQKGKLPDDAYDARLIDQTIQMKVIEALAATGIEQFIKIILVCIILNLIMSAITIAISYKASGMKMPIG